LALTFGTLLSSQGTNTSIEPVSPGPPGASLPILHLRLYQTNSQFRFRDLEFNPMTVGEVFRLSADSDFIRRELTE
ncbi:hypothetical protein ACWF94_35850, partial [Streptomyces sp. NPDC055078]